MIFELWWAVSLATLTWRYCAVTGASSPALSGLLLDTGQCPDGCYCDADEVRIVSCLAVDPYLVLEELSGLTVETLTLEDCLLPDLLGNETALDLTFGYLTSLRLQNCDLNSTLVDGYAVFRMLKSLEIAGNTPLASTSVECDALEHLQHVKIVNSSLDDNPLSNCDTSSLRSLNLSQNNLMEFDMQDLEYFYNLQSLDLSGNSLRSLKPSSSHLSLKRLVLSDNPGVSSVCTSVMRSLPSLELLDISHTGIYQVSLGILEHANLKLLETEGVRFTCDCQTTLRLNTLKFNKLFQHLTCSSPVSGTKFQMTDMNILESLNCGDNLVENDAPDQEYHAGDTVYLDCPLSGGLQSGYEVLWLSPRMDLVRWLPEPQSCPASQDRFQAAPTTSDYSYWKKHYTVMNNGSLRIDLFGWRDRGPFVCYADNGIYNASASVYLKLNYHYRNKLYYLSLAWGFGAAACFLGLTLLGKLLQFLLWNYGCCLCCSCCKDQQPPKIKKLTKVVDSIETYRIQQLEKLRENYNLQSLRIRDNCVMQMEKVRENYHTQVKSLKEMKNYGSAQYSGMKDQYADQISKIREYSSSQLDKCHENYIFQRQRLRKFSAQNYLRIRETKQYTQKTLNRVLENMPALYLDLSSCKQGIGDQDLREWQEEMDRREAEMKDILNTDKTLELGDLGDSQSLYFTPDATPFREISSSKGTPSRDDGGRTIYSPSRSPEKSVGKRGHRRMVSNLSSLFPFWWGVSQTQEVETVAIVEPRRPDDDSAADESLNNQQQQSVPLISPGREHSVPPQVSSCDDYCGDLLLRQQSAPLLSAASTENIITVEPERIQLLASNSDDLGPDEVLSEFTLELNMDQTPEPPLHPRSMKPLSHSVSVQGEDTLCSFSSDKNLHSSNSLPTLAGEAAADSRRLEEEVDRDEAFCHRHPLSAGEDSEAATATSPPTCLPPFADGTCPAADIVPVSRLQQDVADDPLVAAANKNSSSSAANGGELAADESVTESSITDSGINCGDDDEVTRLDCPSLEAVTAIAVHPPPMTLQHKLADSLADDVDEEEEGEAVSAVYVPYKGETSLA